MNKPIRRLFTKAAIMLLMLLLSTVSAGAESSFSWGNGSEGPTCQISDCDISGLSIGYKFTGQPVAVTPVVKYGAQTLTKGTDYTVSYKNSDEVFVAADELMNSGTYTIIITGMGNYEGSYTATFYILGKETLGGYQFQKGRDEESEYYEISSAADYKTLGAYVAVTNEDNVTFGKRFKLMDNISVETMIGTNEDTRSFQGTFDGGGHTLTVTLGGNAENDKFLAPFRYLKSATIKNLTVAGSISSEFVGDGTHGGFAAINNGETTFENCVFKGSLLGTSTTHCGGFVGWNEGTIHYIDCLFAPTSITMGVTGSATFNRNGNNDFVRTYYLTPFGEAQGTRAYTSEVENVTCSSVTAADGNTYYVVATNLTDWATVNAGTQDDPYIIYNTAGLNLLAERVNSGIDYNSDKSHPDGYFFQLGADIAYDPNELTLDLDGDGNNESNFPGIGGSFMVNESFTPTYRYFGGSFDGNGHTISGLYIDKTRCSGDASMYVGLFGENYGTVKNVTVSNANISGSYSVGGIVGKNYGTIKNCHATATVIVNASVSYAGGIAGYNEIDATIENCLVSAATVSGYSEVGGIAGENDNGATIENCLANGATITAIDYKGGAIVGENNCYNGAYNAILSRNYYSNCTLTIGSNSPVTTGIGCGHKATEDAGTYTPTDVSTMTIGDVTYINGAVTPWNGLKNQLANASQDAQAPTVITLDRDYVAESGDSRLVVETNRHAVIDLSGHTIDRNLTDPAQEGNVIYVRGYASLVIRDSQGGGQITGGYVTYGSGGGIASTGNSSVILEGGTICGNKSNNHAGGVFVGGTFTMTGGTITDNINTGNGGSGSAIYTNGGTINLQGGTITGNKGPNAIYLTGTGGHLNVSGSYDLSGNTLADGTTAAPDIMLSGRVITISGALSPAHPATVAFDYGGPTITSGWSTYMSTAKPSTCFVARAYDINNGKFIGKLDDELVLGTPEVVYWHADSDHDGTSEKPYVITTADGLDYLASRVNSGNGYGSNGSHPNGYFFQLGADIAYDPNVLTLDLDGDGTPESNFPGIGGSFMVNKPFMPIYRSFGGSFDGDGHTISGLHIHKNGQDSGNDCVGLFGYNLGIVKNVTVSNANISGSYSVGGIVGRNDGTIENCLVSAATVSGYNKVGGIAGENDYDVTIENCLANGVSITANFLGGAIVGENNRNNGAYNAILSRNYYTGCTLTIGSDSPATTNIGCGNKATEDAGTYTPTDITEMTVNNVTYYDGAFSALILADNADNTSVISSHNGETVNVVLRGRTLYKDGGWNTLCLPFNVSTTSGILAGDDVQAMTLDTSTSSLDGTTLTLNFTEVSPSGEQGGLILAGTPFIIKWATPESPATDLVNPTFSGVTVNNSASTEVSFTGGKFVGNYSLVTLPANDKSKLFMGGGNNLYWPETDITVNAFRAYFELSDGNAQVKSFVLNFGEEEATSLSEELRVKSEESADAWFSIDGRRLSGKPNKAGIYIHGNRKVVIK